MLFYDKKTSVTFPSVYELTLVIQALRHFLELRGGMGMISHPLLIVVPGTLTAILVLCPL